MGTRLGIENAVNHAIGITASQEKGVAFGIPESSLLKLPESISGRYSLWAGIGLPIAIALGFDRFIELLEGAADMDQHFLYAEPSHNLPLILGLLGIWYNNVANFDGDRGPERFLLYHSNATRTPRDPGAGVATS